MKAPEWLKPSLYGAAFGAMVLAVVGFSWGGWVTGPTARQMAVEQADSAVVAALAPICLEQSKRDPQIADKLVQLKTTSRYKRSDFVMSAGWATMPGATEAARRQVADACVDKLGL